MTREEAIETLINHTQYKCNGDDLIALDIAIKALEHPEQNVITVVPCGDAINREDALMCLTGEIKDTDTIETIIARFIKRLRSLPPVTPQPKTGHWVGIDEEPHEVWECDHCGFVIYGSGCIDPYDYLDTYKFCPNCGCRMFEPQESEVTE